MGLLGDFEDPKTQGLLALGLGLLNSRGNFGQGLGQAGMGAMQAMQQAQQAQQKKQLQDSQLQAQGQQMQAGALHMQLQQQQLAEAQQKASEQQRMRAFLEGLQSPQQAALAAGGGPTNANAAAIDPMQTMMLQGVRAGAVPLQSYLQSLQKDETPIPVKEGETLVDRRTYQPKFTGPAKEDDFIKHMRSAGIQPGSPQWQSLLMQKAQKDASHAPPVNVSVSMDKGFGEAFAKDAAGSLASSRDQAKAAANTVQTLDRISATLSSGNVALGPTAPFETFARQIADTVGIGGKDNAEKLANTRKMIQGAATLAMDGAAALKGQGQITEGERAMVARASGGNIDTMTAPEVKQLITVLGKVNRQKIAAHQQQLGNVGKQFSPFVPFYQVDMPQSAAPGIDDLLLKYGGK